MEFILTNLDFLSRIGKQKSPRIRHCLWESRNYLNELSKGDRDYILYTWKPFVLCFASKRRSFSNQNKGHFWVPGTRFGVYVLEGQSPCTCAFCWGGGGVLYELPFYQIPGTPSVPFFKATLHLKPATIALKIRHLAFQVCVDHPPLGSTFPPQPMLQQQETFHLPRRRDTSGTNDSHDGNRRIGIRWRSNSPHIPGTNQLMVNCWFGVFVVWDSRDTPKKPNPFHKGILGIQTTNPNQQLTTSWKNSQEKKTLRLGPLWPHLIQKKMVLGGSSHLVRS